MVVYECKRFLCSWMGRVLYIFIYIWVWVWVSIISITFFVSIFDLIQFHLIFGPNYLHQSLYKWHLWHTFLNTFLDFFLFFKYNNLAKYTSVNLLVFEIIACFHSFPLFKYLFCRILKDTFNFLISVSWISVCFNKLL